VIFSFVLWTVEAEKAEVCNAALHKPAYQISVMTSMYGQVQPAFLANDGNRTNTAWAGSCAATQWDENPWWVVDLGFPMTVNFILLTNHRQWQCEFTSCTDVNLIIPYLTLLSCMVTSPQRTAQHWGRYKFDPVLIPNTTNISETTKRLRLLLTGVGSIVIPYIVR